MRNRERESLQGKEGGSSSIGERLGDFLEVAVVKEETWRESPVVCAVRP